mgnify:CR=1 FL=1
MIIGNQHYYYLITILNEMKSNENKQKKNTKYGYINQIIYFIHLKHPQGKKTRIKSH